MDTYYTDTASFDADLCAALPVLKEINDLYNAGESIRQRIAMRKTNKKADYSKTAKLKAALAAIVLYSVLTLILRTIIARIVMKTGFGGLVPIYCIIGIGVCVYVYFHLKNYFANLNPTETATDISAEKQLEKISGEIYRLTTENNSILEKIPADYRCYDAVLFMDRALRNGRADSKKEVINLYEEELHRRRLEANSAVSVHIQQQQCKMLSDIEYNSRRAAVNSGIAATFSILAYLGKD